MIVVADLGQALLLLLAGIGSGVVGYGAGLASLVSFPALLATGLMPLAANLTNSVALTGTTLGGLVSARTEVAPQRRRVIKFGAIALLGGAVGAVLLLRLPADTFERVVPWLIALGSVVLLLRPWLRRLHAGRLSEHGVVVALLVGAVAVYAGYFGAGAGVLVLAILGAVMDDSLAHLSALRTVIVGGANVVAAVIFAITGPVAWGSVLPLAIGAVIGSALGPPIVRRVPETPLRVVVALAGFALAIKVYLDYAR